MKRKNIQWFQKRLLNWFDQGNGRDFSWRRVRDRYRILVSEMMLRRTRADQVAPVYERFIRLYPDLDSLANASKASVMKELKPLGLEWRASDMVSMVAEVREKYSGEVPILKENLLSLSGVGEYVASAVRCFSVGERETLIDTNIVRVIGRFFGLRLEGEARRRKEMIHALTACVPENRAREYHYAVIDFAAKVCLPRKPLCNSCILSAKCIFYRGRNLDEQD